MKKFVSYVAHCLYDRKTRFNIGILLSIIFNSFYIVFNIILGILYENAWFVAVSAYYILILVLRYMLVGEQQRDNVNLVSTLMLIISLPMSGMIVYTIINGPSSKTPSRVLPVLVIYAIFSIFRALYGILAPEDRLPGKRSFYISRLSMALLSLFNFQTVLLDFLKVTESVAIALNFITGGAVSISVLALCSKLKSF